MPIVRKQHNAGRLVLLDLHVLGLIFWVKLGVSFGGVERFVGPSALVNMF